MPEKYKNEVSFEPNDATLMPNETSHVLAVFTPLKRKEYQISIPLFTMNQDNSVENAVGYFSPGSGLNLA